MPEPDHFRANLQRGSLLLNQNRHREALPFLQAAIAANPDSPLGYAELARCWSEIPSERSKAIGAIDRAIALEPNSSFYLGCKAWYLVGLTHYGAAGRVARAGLAINPHCPRSLNSLANVYTKTRHWREAEAACRRILELHPNDPPALNLLAQALRHQGRWKESRDVVAHLLSNLPNSPFGHANAGFAALLAGDHLRANEHFRESLRMNPQFDLARRGLIQSLVARNWMVRLHIRIATWARRPLRGWWAAAVFAVFVAVFLLAAFLASMQSHYWVRVLGHVLAIAFYAVLFFLYVSRGAALLGNFLLIFDSVGRHALTTREKIKASIPVAIFFVIVVCLVLAHLFWWAAGLTVLFASLVLSIQWPLLIDRWQRRRLEKSEE